MDNKKVQEVISKEYLKNDSSMDVDSRIINILSKKVVELTVGPQVLEMGVGVDQYTEKIIKKFGHSSVVEISELLVSKIKARYGEKVTPYLSAFEDFNPSMKFDSILATNVLEHVKDRIGLLINVKNWLNESGELIITVPNAESIHRLMGVELGILKSIYSLSESDLRIGHRVVYDKGNLELDIIAAGYKIVSTHNTYLKMLSNSQMSEFTDQQLEALFSITEKIKNNNAVLLYVCKIA